MTIVKVGGSLLDWPEFPAKLDAWLELRKSERLALVIGGGGAADWIRDLDRIHDLGPERSHSLAVRSLDLTARIVAAMVSGLEVVEEMAGLEEAWVAGYVPVLTPRLFLEADGDDPLPLSWDVTSDSIAAKLALQLGADTLILLKSAGLPGGADGEEAARIGLVDPYFPVISRFVENVEVVNFRT